MDIIKPGRYRHFKGKEYQVLGMATDAQTMQALVVYQALYGERGWWVRPVQMFGEAVQRDGVAVPRFAYLDEGDQA